jgi:hypothetical protein
MCQHCRKRLSFGYGYFPDNCDRDAHPADALIVETQRLNLYEETTSTQIVLWSLDPVAI